MQLTQHSWPVVFEKLQVSTEGFQDGLGRCGMERSKINVNKYDPSSGVGVGVRGRMLKCMFLVFADHMTKTEFHEG